MAQTVHSNELGSNHTYFNRLGNISNNHRARQNNHNRRLRTINLLYRLNSSLSSSVKNNKARQTPIANIKNHIKSYFILNISALIHTCWINKASSKKIIVVIKNIQIYCIINFHLIFFNIRDQVTFFVFSLFFICLIHFFILTEIYRIMDMINIKRINSFHIQNKVQNVPSRPSLNVTNVCKKNCNNSQITNILHSKINRRFSDLEQILDHRDVSFFIIVEKRPKRRCLIFYFF